MKKTYSNWYAGLIHFSIAGVAVPILFSIAISLPLIILFWLDPERSLNGFDFTSPFFVYSYFLIVGSVIYYPGTWYSALYFKRKIEILDARKVIISATVFMVIFSLVMDYVDYYNMSKEGPIDQEYYMRIAIELVINTALFYLLSHYHFRKNGLILVPSNTLPL